MDIEKKYMLQVKNQKTFIDLSVNGESNFGFIVDFNDEFLIFEAFDTNGIPDGITVFFREESNVILRWGGNEITSTEKVLDHTRRLQKMPKINLESVETIVKSVNEAFRHITVCINDFEDTCFIGQVREIDEDTLILNEFGSKIALDRKFVMIPLNAISKIQAGGQYELSLVKLYIDER